ncbi:MAG: YgjV family protein [Lachnospiraceae bacterium]|nr:YgjV family protein [Lachnospiraceae bacterium]MBQ6241613.1 YgjV family protein [Lachnospiraceae bacterium]
MDPRTWLEIAGYIGSALVLLSFLMTSVVKLRLVNMAGSFISFIYALIIGSYPLALMNCALVLINLYFLWKIRHTRKDYRILETAADDPVLVHFLTEYAADIGACFPGIDTDPAAADVRGLILCEDTPAGIVFLKTEGTAARLLLDYSMPRFRDFSLGAFLADELKARGFTELRYGGPDQNHRKYLEKLRFVRDPSGTWIKKL